MRQFKSMSIREIIPVWQAGEFNECQCRVLKNQCNEVTFPLDKITKQEVNDLIDTFLAEVGGVGLAAPQIGINKSFFAFDPKYRFNGIKTMQTMIVAINPKTVPSRNDLSWLNQVKEDDLIWQGEGCLSLPGVSTEVPRLKKIKLKAFDIDGKAFSKKFEDFVARIVQHEMDHLYGRIIIDYDATVYSTNHDKTLLSRLIEKVRNM